MKKLFDSLSAPMEALGNTAKEAMEKSSEGFADLFVSTFKLGNEIFFGGSQKTVQVFVFLFAHREAVAEHFYPTRELKNKLKDDSDNIFLKYDLYRAEKNKKRFFRKLAMNLSLLPHQKILTRKMLDQSMELEGVKRSIDEAQLLKGYEKLMGIINELESDEEILAKKKELRYFILLKIELDRTDGMEEYLEVAKIAQIEDVALLEALWLKAQGEIRQAAMLLSKAAKEDVPGALEELALLLDALKEKGNLGPETEIDQLSEEHFGTGLNSSKLAKLKALPLNFFILKKEQLMDIIKTEGKKHER